MTPSKRNFLMGLLAGSLPLPALARTPPPDTYAVYWIVAGEEVWGRDYPPFEALKKPDPRFEIWDPEAKIWTMAVPSENYPFQNIDRDGTLTPANYGIYVLGLAYVRATGRRLRLFVSVPDTSHIGAWLYGSKPQAAGKPPSNYHPYLPFDLERRTDTAESIDQGSSRPTDLFKPGGYRHPSLWMGHRQRKAGEPVAILDQLSQAGVSPAHISKVIFWQGQSNDREFAGSWPAMATRTNVYAYYLDSFIQMVRETVGSPGAFSLAMLPPMIGARRDTMRPVFDSLISSHDLKVVNLEMPEQPGWKDWPNLGFEYVSGCLRIGELSAAQKQAQPECQAPLALDEVDLSWQGLEAAALRTLDTLYASFEPAPDDRLYAV